MQEVEEDEENRQTQRTNSENNEATTSRKHALSTQQYCNNYMLQGTGPVTAFKFNITYEEYERIQNLGFMDMLRIFPGIQQFTRDYESITIKGFGKNRIRQCNFGDNVKEVIMLQRISLEQDEERRLELESRGIAQLTLHHSFYNIIPIFMIPYKHYHADMVHRCAERRRNSVLENNEEYPSVRQTFRWAKTQENPEDNEMGTIVIFDKDEKGYRDIIRREEVRRWRRR